MKEHKGTTNSKKARKASQRNSHFSSSDQDGDRGDRRNRYLCVTLRFHTHTYTKFTDTAY